MAEVFLAVERLPGGGERRVVVKRVLEHVAADEELARLFAREARISLRLVHPNIVRSFGVGSETTRDGDEQPYLVMEWLAGTDLRVALDGHAGPLPIAAACEIAAGVARALQYAHTLADADGRALGIVHRDVSPANIFLTTAGEVKLLDFGIAASALRSRSTTGGALRGKLAYAAPEQVDGLDVDERTDLFALGVVLWEMLTGKRLFHRARDMDTILAIKQGPVAPPSSLAPGVPAELDALVLALLAKFPLSRPVTANVVAVTLETLLARLDRGRDAPLAIMDIVAKAAP